MHAPRLASALRKRWTRLSNPQCDIRFGPGVHLGPGFRVEAPYGGRLVVGAGSEFRQGCRFELSGPTSQIEIGERCTFTAGGLIQISTTLSIGPDSIFGQDVMVADGAHRFRDHTTPFQEQGYDFRPLHFGQGVVVHSKCTIVHHLEDRAVVGANSLVTRPVPAFCLAGGVPAKVLDYFGPPELAPAGWAPAASHAS